MITYHHGTDNDIEGVLNLQSKNLAANLNSEQMKKGFVTTPFTEAQIEDIIHENGLFIAKDKSEIIAYIFAGSWNYFSQWEIFNYMVSRFPNLSFNGIDIGIQNSFQYGPVCIDINYRGKGIFNELFECMRLEFVKKYPLSLTFINQVNAISTGAHIRKIGWKIIDEFEFNNNQYYGLAIDMHHSVKI